MVKRKSEPKSVSFQFLHGLGGELSRCEESRDKYELTLDVTMVSRLDSSMFPAANSICQLSVEHEGLPDQTVAEVIRHCENLQGLRFIKSDCGSETLSAISNLDSLEEVALYRRNAALHGDDLAAALQGSMHLSNLEITDRGLSDAGLSFLSRNNIQNLGLPSNNLQTLTGLPESTKHLLVDRNPLTRNSWESVSRCEKLESLSLTGCGLQGDWFDSLLHASSLETLTFLAIIGCNVTDANLAAILSRDVVRHLQVSCSELGAKSLDVLRASNALESMIVQVESFELITAQLEDSLGRLPKLEVDFVLG